LERIGDRNGDAVTKTVALRPALDTLFRQEQMAKPFLARGASSHASRTLTTFASRAFKPIRSQRFRSGALQQKIPLQDGLN
jgi:hypothetical protein